MKTVSACVIVAFAHSREDVFGSAMADCANADEAARIGWTRLGVRVDDRELPNVVAAQLATCTEANDLDLVTLGANADRPESSVNVAFAVLASSPRLAADECQTIFDTSVDAGVELVAEAIDRV